MTIQEIIALTGLSARAFAAKYNIPYRSVQNWTESVRNCPEYVLELLEFKVKYDMEAKDNE